MAKGGKYADFVNHLHRRAGEKAAAAGAALTDRHVAVAASAAGTEAVRKRHFLSHLYIKCIILPRQARDEHRENSKKVPFSLRVSARCRLSCRQRPQRCSKGSSCATAPPPQLQAARPQRPRRLLLLLLLLFRQRCCRRCRSCDGPCSRSRRPTVRKTPCVCTILY